nr:MAG TPA: hypothetical protein [Caudoviricetes sp.]
MNMLYININIDSLTRFVFAITILLTILKF